ncbi:AAA family ATPase [Larkinella bovis]|uniref:AAA family ATPase n=1 Tax=Larkinella bovis TaxID=683041 RepID=A0ABW0I7A7_9BACT
MSTLLNEKLELARNFVLHTHRNVFLTGKAGTGKTTFLRQLRQLTSKRLVVVAPTGVAAINAGGVTIHSLFQLPFGALPPGALRPETRKFTREKIRLFRTLDLLVIDEISMVRADVLDGIDAILRRFRHRSEPFGGVQLLLIGDMQQLPPVVREADWTLLKPYYETAYFFGSLALQKTPYVSIELEHIYRQADQRFIDILNSIREKRITASQLAELNQRYVATFSPPDHEGFITLTTHTRSAHQINSAKLLSLPTPSHILSATIEGEFPENAFPTDANLELKVGAQVMFVKNDLSREKQFYNGKIGQITDMDAEIVYVKCPTDPAPLAVSPLEWLNIRYSMDPETHEIREEPIGRFVQHPLKLAWAITIHKSQGLTFDKAIIDAASAFAHGQVYVALSRCKTLDGLVLREPIPSHSIKSELLLDEFHEQVQTQTPDEHELWQSRRMHQEQLLLDLFSFDRSDFLTTKCQKVIGEHKGALEDAFESGFNSFASLFSDKVRGVAVRFQRQLQSYFSEIQLPEENPLLQDRIQKASSYFKEVISQELIPLLENTPRKSRNQQVQALLRETIDELGLELFIKLRCFESSQGGFEALSYLKNRHQAELAYQPSSRVAKDHQENRSGPEIGKPQTLYDALVKWRHEMATTHDTVAPAVLSRKTLAELIAVKPSSPEELLKIKGFNKTKVRQVGEEILGLIRKYG